MKTKYVGQKTLNDPETGESYDFDIISKSYDSLDKKGWRRVIMSDLMEAIEQIGNRKLKVLEFLVDNMNGENQINLTYRKIAEETKTSYGTVAETFKALKEANLIKKHGGLYVLNTTIISAYGSTEKNAYLTIEYNFTNRSLVKENPFEKVKSNIKLQRELESKNKELAKKEKELEELRKQEEEFKKQQEELKELKKLLAEKEK